MKTTDVRLATPEERTTKQRNCLLKPTDISPYLAYVTLKAWFGIPDDEAHDPTNSQWIYQLMVPGAFVELYDWKDTSWSVGVYADSANEAEAHTIGHQFLDLLRKQATRHTAKMKAAADGAQAFLIQNPFALYYASAHNILSCLREPDVATDEDGSSHGVDAPVYQDPDLCKSTFFLFMTAFEGLMNLIYDLYLKPELRDDRIAERLSREQIDLKIRLAPVYCTCFKDDLIDKNNEIFKTFHSIVNLRNDFVHANVTKTMRHPLVQEDGRTFFLDMSTRNAAGFPKNISDLTTEDLVLLEQSIDAMIDVLIDHMQPRYRREFETILTKEYIHIEIEDGEVMVIT